jgi:hypothetical protein
MKQGRIDFKPEVKAAISGSDNEEQYELLVTSLEARYATIIRREAEHGLRLGRKHGEVDESVEDFARDHVTSVLLNDEAWYRVNATDISDIASEAVELARREEDH